MTLFQLSRYLPPEADAQLQSGNCRKGLEAVIGRVAELSAYQSKQNPAELPTGFIVFSGARLQSALQSAAPGSSFASE